MRASEPSHPWPAARRTPETTDTRMKPWTAAKIRALKGRERIPCLTAYDAQTASFLEAAGIPFILVGDSVGTTQLGYSSTPMYLYPAITAYPDLFEVVQVIPKPDTYLLRFDRQKAAQLLSE